MDEYFTDKELDEYFDLTTKISQNLVKKITDKMESDPKCKEALDKLRDYILNSGLKSLQKRPSFSLPAYKKESLKNDFDFS